jgi:HEAT repeat protein/lysophospholipase L1-like esterase
VRLRGAAANIVLASAATVLFLAVLEGAARLLEPRRNAPPPVADYIWDWSEKMPGQFYTMKTDAIGWPPWEEFNRDGLRDRTRPVEKPEGFWRVAVLGDSVTLGAEVRPYEAFPQVMEARLAAAGRRVEVMNVALWGWSTRQERIAWQRIARRYRPDQAVLAVCLNDIPELQNNLTRPPSWLARLHERSALVRRVVNAGGREIDSVERLFDAADSPPVREALSRFLDEVTLLRSEVEKDGATLALVVFPFRFQVEAGAPRAVVEEQIADYCRAETLRCLDLLPTLSRVGPSAFVDYDHLSPSGASLVADTILASGLLPDGYSDADTLRAAGGVAPSKLLTASDAGARAAAAWALGRDRKEAVALLAERLAKDESARVRAAAARSLGALGTKARPAVGALSGALGDPSEAVRYEAAQAWTRVGPEPSDVAALSAALTRPDPYVRGFAAWALGNLEGAAGEAVPALVAALNEDDTATVVAAALARIGPGAAQAVPALVASLKDADAGRRWRSARALGRIGPAAAGAVGDLEAALADPNEAVRVHAARALGRIGPAARPAAAALQRATGDPDPSVRQEARGALERLH